MISTTTLYLFCHHSDHSGYDLKSPWRADGKIYATDGRILIAIDDDGRELPAGGKQPKAAGLLQPAKTNGGDWPTTEGKTVGKCDECGGLGVFGVSPCRKCRASGLLVRQTIDGVTIDGHYTALVRSLGDVRYAVTDDRSGLQFFGTDSAGLCWGS